MLETLILELKYFVAELETASSIRRLVWSPKVPLRCCFSPSSASKYGVFGRNLSGIADLRRKAVTQNLRWGEIWIHRRTNIVEHTEERNLEACSVQNIPVFRQYWSLRV